ncbi:MAG: hypothetical protein HW383_333 [Candidatus Magasanikbacteria bacterium]|nr:hypothetical protein [Candidatus Magasanikbacteria bacterium]
MQTIKHIISGVPARVGIDKQLEAARVIEITAKILTDIFGAEKAKSMKPLYLKNRTITIATLSPAVAQDLKLKEKQIVGELNKAFPDAKVERIRYLL